MLEGKRVLGVCLTRIQDRTRGDFLTKLNQAALESGYKIICFNSFEDFSQDDLYSQGAETIFDRIDYRIVDGLLICEEHFQNPAVVDRILERANLQNIPVVLVNGKRDGYYCVRHDYRQAFQEMIRHLCREHQITDFFFMSGRSEEYHSQLRLNYFREVMKEFGIAFDEEHVGYGDYWEDPAAEIAAGLIREKKIPRAIVCANDSMALGVCQKLKENGYRIPEDVIVTGFDGISATRYLEPKLTTCQEDRAGLAHKCIEYFRQIFRGETPENLKIVSYRTIYAESCGCRSVSGKERSADIAVLYRRLQDMEAHEEYVTSNVDRMLNVEQVRELYAPLAEFIVKGSWMCANSRFMRLASKNGWDPSVTAAIPCAYDVGRQLKYVQDQLMVPDLEEWAEDKTCYILTSIYSQDICCGYYAVRTEKVNDVNFKIKKVARLTNLVCNALLNQFQKRNMLQDRENAVYVDAMTGLPNLKGASKWFEDFSARPENHQKFFAVTIYAIPQYTFLYETYGIHEVEEIFGLLAGQLVDANQRDCFLAKISESEFLVLNYFSNEKEMREELEEAGNQVRSAVDDFNRMQGKEYHLEVSTGCTAAGPGWSGNLGAFIKYASNEMFLNRMKKGGGETVREKISYKDFYSVFSLLVDNNLFAYHFQPIVDARTGEIYAYEALMRTVGGISLSPSDVLDIASEYKRLNEIEHATLFNVIQQYADEFEAFQGRRVFINTIPNHFLSDKECEELHERFKKYFDYFVFEVTEQDTSSDEELEAIKRLGGEAGQAQIAIDDCGTGHSNIVNLLRYSPQIIKVDHYLIHGIEKDTNKQMFLKNTIEFASMNHIKVLAEGVETAEELKTVIEYGVDLIQGFYTGRPADKPADSIEDRIRNEIIRINLRLTKFNKNRQKIYTVRDGENVDLVKIALQNYNILQIPSGEVKLIGRKDSTIDMITRIADNAEVKLTLLNANVSGVDEPSIQIGKGAKVELELEGCSTISKSGIYVPKDARLNITGEGMLFLNTNRNDGVGIGARCNEAYGAISFAHTGRIKVICSGDKLIGVGGGHSTSAISVRSGVLEIVGSGVSVVGIGSASGETDICIGDAEVVVKESGNEAVGIGTLEGKAKIESSGKLNVVSDGEVAAAIGTLYGIGGTTKLKKGTISATVHCDRGTVIGAAEGVVHTYFDDCEVNAYAEGACATGIGSVEGSCITEISGGILRVKVLSGESRPFGNRTDKLVITGGNVICENDDADTEAQNAYGQKLHREYKDGPVFEKQIITKDGEYTYSARRCPELDLLCVYLP